MRRPILVFLIAVVLCASLGIGVILWRRSTRRPPTVAGWRAHVITLAGDGSPSFRDTGQSTHAAFADPFGVAVAPDGTIYVADAGDSNRIRKITIAGVVTTLAGSAEGHSDGPGSQAAFNTPSGIALDGSGNLYVADTGNNRIRKVTPEGLVSTVAGDGTVGYVDGPANQARFNGPIGVAVDTTGNIYVADTYNDRIRRIAADGQVTTVAGGAGPGYLDGNSESSLFDTPCGVVVAADGALIVADTGNHRLRRITPDRQVTTLPISFSGEVANPDLRRPTGLVQTHDGFLYVTEPDRARLLQIAPSGAAVVIAGSGPGYVDGFEAPRFNQPTGVALDYEGSLLVADSGNYLVRKLAASEQAAGASNRAQSPAAESPRLTPETLGQQTLLWPIDPQQRPHEVVATIGEARGSFDPPESRHHLHSGLDIAGNYGEVVRVIRSEKVTGANSNWALGDLNEGIRVGIISYIHIQVGRDKDDKIFDEARFVPIRGSDGKLQRLRVRRGTRFQPGDAIGTVNRMYHVHLNVGPPGAEINPLSLSPIGFSDKVSPVIEKDGIQLFDETGSRLTEKHAGRLVVKGKLRIVVDAYDRADLNAERRRLGLYRLGYQLLKLDGTPVPGFEEPRITIEFNRLPERSGQATKLAYAEESGITVYGSERTRFLYEVTNTVRNGQAAAGTWDTSELPPGDYVLRVIAADYSGNEVHEGRDVSIVIR